jgi:hypothetical protein
MIDGTEGLGEAQRMLEAFDSVGATNVDITWTNAAGDPRRPRTLKRALQSLGGKLPEPKNPDWLNSVHIEGIAIGDLARTLPAMLDTANAERLNLIVRPYGDGVTLMQLDDLSREKLARVAPAMFLSIETSPGNFQAWLAIAGSEDKEFTRRVKRAADADMGASGATRIAGSVNLKQKYAPNNPRVAIREMQPGHITNAAKLEGLGLVAPPEEFAPLPATPARFDNRGGRILPSYEVAVGYAPMNRAGTDKDYSAADIGWCITAIRRNFTVEEATAMLLEVSEHARHPSNGKRYAERTASKAAKYVAERSRPRLRMKRDHG